MLGSKPLISIVKRHSSYRQDRLCGILPVRRHRQRETKTVQAVEKPNLTNGGNLRPDRLPAVSQLFPQGCGSREGQMRRTGKHPLPDAGFELYESLVPTAYQAANRLLDKATARQPIRRFDHSLYRCALQDGVDEVFLQIERDLLIRLQKGRNDRIDVPAAGATKAEDVNALSAGVGNSGSFEVTVTMRDTCAALRASLGAIRFRDTVQSDKIEILL